MKNMNQYYLGLTLVIITFGFCLFVIVSGLEQEKTDIKNVSNNKDTKINSLTNRIYKLEYLERFYKRTIQQSNKSQNELRDNYFKAFNLLSNKNKLKFDLGKDISPAYSIDIYDGEEKHNAHLFHNLMMDDPTSKVNLNYSINLKKFLVKQKTSELNKGDFLIINKSGQLEKYILWGQPVAIMIDNNKIEFIESTSNYHSLLKWLDKIDSINNK